MKSNIKKTEVTPGLKTHGGAPAAKESAEKELVRTVSGCLLFEDSHYESGTSIAKRIQELSKEVSIDFLGRLAIRAREDLKLRHVPLYLAVQMLAIKGTQAERNLVGETIARIIQRADELAEIVAIYWKNGKKPLPRQLKSGIAKAFRKFNEYQLAKWDRDSAIKLRDVLFLSHPKAENEEQDKLWKRLIDRQLQTPDTWEVSLSKGKDKKETFTRLLEEGKLGYSAFLQNLRNMVQSGVDAGLVEKQLVERASHSKELPFKFIVAAKHAPQFEEAIGKAMVIAAGNLPKLRGHTLLVVDVSGSMGSPLARRSEMTRVDAAAGLSILMREQCEKVTIYLTAGSDPEQTHETSLVPSRHGFALSDAVQEGMHSLGGGGIFLVQAMEYINREEKGRTFDRVVVFTDEQDCDHKQPASKAAKLGPWNYIVNVGVYEPALPVTGAGWTRVSGFSERVIEWISAEEGIERELFQ